MPLSRPFLRPDSRTTESCITPMSRRCLTGKAAKMATNEAIQTTKNLASVVLLKGAQYPIFILFMLLVPRMMGPEQYGQYALLISITAIVTALTDLGITEIYGRFVPEWRLQNDVAAITKFSSYLLA